MDKPHDPITIKEAAALAGKSLDTIRRWRKSKGLEGWREPGNPTAPVLLSKSQLLQVAADAAYAHTLAEPPSAPVKRKAAATSAWTSAGVIAALQANLGDLRDERDHLRQVLDSTRAEADQLRHELKDTRAKVRALEAQLNQGKRGLLSRLAGAAGFGG